MAAHLDLFHLRRHAVPEHFTAMFARKAGPAVTQPVSSSVAPRPRLLASWRIGADGRLACTWSAASDDPA